MDRTPSTHSITETPRGDMRSPLGSDDGDGKNESSDTLKLVAFSGCMDHTSSSPGGAPVAVQQRVSSNDIQSCSKKMKGCHKRSLNTVGTLEERYAATAQQLEKVKQMYYFLDTHNDRLEEAFMVLRTRIDAIRSLLLSRLSRTAQELRRETRVLRNTASFLMNDFIGCMQQYQKLIIEGLRNATLGPLADGCHNSDSRLHVNLRGVDFGIPASSREQCRRENRDTESLLPMQHTREEWAVSPSRPTSQSCAILVKDSNEMEEVVQQRSALEQQLRLERENHQKHLLSMKEMYVQKEITLTRRVELLESLIRQDACGVFSSDGHNLSRHDEVKERYHSSIPQCGDASANESGGVEASCTSSPIEGNLVNGAEVVLGGMRGRVNHAKDGNEMFTGDIYSTRNAGLVPEKGLDADHRERQHSRPEHKCQLLRSLGLCDSDKELLAKLEQNKNGRMLSQLMWGQHSTSHRNSAIPRSSDPMTKQEERRLEEIAGQLLNLVDDSRTTQHQEQHHRGIRWHDKEFCRDGHSPISRGAADVVSRLYHLQGQRQERPHINTNLSPVPRSGRVLRPDKPSDVSTVARGLWAEDLLRKRAWQRSSSGPG